MRSERIEWYKNELKKIADDVMGDNDTALYTKTKAMKLLNLINSEIAYGGGDVPLLRHEYIDMKESIKDVINTMVEQECLRRSRLNRSL